MAARRCRPMIFPSVVPFGLPLTTSAKSAPATISSAPAGCCGTPPGEWVAGSAFDGEGVHTNVSTAFVMETLLGPMVGGFSVGFDGRNRIYVGMGPLFQRR